MEGGAFFARSHPGTRDSPQAQNPAITIYTTHLTKKSFWPDGAGSSGGSAFYGGQGWGRLWPECGRHLGRGPDGRAPGVKKGQGLGNIQLRAPGGRGTGGTQPPVGQKNKTKKPGGDLGAIWAS